LTLKSELGTDIYNSVSSIRIGELPSDITGVPNDQAQETTSQNYKVVVNNTINFNHIFGSKHFVQGVIGQSYEYSNEYSNSIAGSDFFSSALVGVGAAQTKRVISSGRQEWALFSAFARLNYQYLRKYMAGVTYRIDGSSRFNKDNRYLGTPSISAGWRLSEEKFIRENLPMIDELKLRASIGWSSKDGNSSYYGSQATYTLANTSYGGNSYLVMSQPGNADLKWERTITYDYGLDLSIFKNRLDVTLDYYYKKTTNMLFSSNLPLYTGYTAQLQNIADMENRGLEVKIISQNVKTKDFMWQSILNFSHNSNKILRLNFDGNQLADINSGSKYYAEGQAAAQFYLYDWAGVDPQTGEPLWRYADGTLSTTPPAADSSTSDANRKICGTGTPKIYGGFTNNLTYKDWELNFLFTFSCGGKLMNSTRAELLKYSSSNDKATNLSKEIMRMWQIEGQETDIPKLDNASIVNGYDYTVGLSTRFLESSTFLRLKNLEVAYNVPKKWLKKTGFLQRFKVYANMTNLFTITPYSGLDPEVSAFGSSATSAGYDNMTMPSTRSYQFGIRASF
jgi:TonB-linked SusC/RagA family outer membrane protein